MFAIGRADHGSRTLAHTAVRGDRTRAWLLVVVACLLATPAASKIDDVKKAYKNLDYETCISAAESALDEPAERKAREDAYRYLGLCQAALGDTEGARDAFEKLLAVNVEATLPKGLSPRFTSSFLEAKGQWVDAEPTGLVIEKDVLDEKTRILTIRIEDRLGMLATVQWRDPDGDLHDEVRVAERMEIQVPNQVARELVAFDARGGVITTLDLAPKSDEKDRRIDTRQAEIEETDDEDTGVDFTPWLLLGASAAAATFVVVAAAGIGVGVFIYEPQSVTMTGGVAFAGDPTE